MPEIKLYDLQDMIKKKMVISKLNGILKYHWVDTVNGLNKNYGNIDVINNQAVFFSPGIKAF